MHEGDTFLSLKYVEIFKNYSFQYNNIRMVMPVPRVHNTGLLIPTRKTVHHRTYRPSSRNAINGIHFTAPGPDFDNKFLFSDD